MRSAASSRCTPSPIAAAPTGSGSLEGPRPGRFVAEAGGWILVEVSPDRARSVAKVLQEHGFADVRSTVDSGFKVTRVLVGRRP